MILKTNLHFHTDDEGGRSTIHSFYQGINHAEKLRFRVIGLTCHKRFTYKKEYADYARRHGVTLIPGIEANIEGRHVIVLNCDRGIERVANFQELREYKQKNPQIFILAPHSFFPRQICLRGKLEKNIDLFDAIELSWYYLKWINFNKKARLIAQKYNKPFIATSDTHLLEYLNTSYALIDSKSPEIKDILEAIKKGQFKNVTSPISLKDAIRFWFRLWFNTSPV